MELALVINGGSSTVKVALFQKGAHEPVWQKHEPWEGNYKTALREILKEIPSKKLVAIGHRVVHGGEKFETTTLVTEEVKEQIRELIFLAPLHNPINLSGIEVCESLFPHVPNFAVFDTAFHAQMPEAAYTYPIPLHYRLEGIRRYGFHGISYAYCSRRAAHFLNRNLTDLKLLICHLGAGASLCAIKNGVGIDTTMGMTPLEGLMMATRSGSIDPGILLYLLRKGKTPEALDEELNHASGLLGISETTSDMHLLIEAAEKGDEKAGLALDLYIHRLRQCLGAMIASLGGIDVLVFTAGVGENAPLIREKACALLAFAGVEIDPKKNRSPSHEEREIASLTKHVHVLVIPTQEELQIALECFQQVYDNHSDRGLPYEEHGQLKYR